MSFGSLLSIPYIITFYFVWIISSLWRPIIVVTLICVLSNPTSAIKKFHMFITTVTFLLFCNDKKWKKPKQQNDVHIVKNRKTDSANDGKTSTATDKQQQEEEETQKSIKKTIIFVRHGESTWNDTFNRGDRKMLHFLINFIPNLFYAIIMEWYYWCCGQHTESWFYDSPLSNKGIQQSISIHKYLTTTDLKYATPKEANLIRILRGDTTTLTTVGESNGHSTNGQQAGSANGNKKNNNDDLSSQLVSSNLRRAISTMAIGFQDRILHNNNSKCKNVQGDSSQSDDKILILTCLQEVSCNPDALSITPPNGNVYAASSDPIVIRNEIYKKYLDTTMYKGNKDIHGNGLLRMYEFCHTIFHQSPKLKSKKNIIVAGHSFWFRAFFRTFLPEHVQHICKKKKIVNGGIVAFTLTMMIDDTDTDNDESAPTSRYTIDPGSIVVLHGGF